MKQHTLRQFLLVLEKLGLRRGPSYLPANAALLGFFGEKHTPAERELYVRHTGREPGDKAFRLLACFIGRRGGKNEMAAVLVVFLAIFRKWTTAPGEKATVMLLAVDRKQAEVAFDRILGLLRAVPALEREIAKVTSGQIELKSGVTIEVTTADLASVRGRSLIACVLDEFWFWPDATAKEVVRAIGPSMATQPDAKMIILSSVFSAHGPAFELWSQWGQPDEKQLIVRGTTLEFHASPHMQEFVADAMRRDREGAGAEFMNILRADIGRPFDISIVQPALRALPLEIPFVRGTPQGGSYQYTAGIDTSGGRGDAAACAIARMDGDRVIVVAARRWPSPHAPDVVAKEIAAFLRSYELTEAIADAYAAEFAVSAYRKVGVELRPAEMNRSEAYLHLLPLFSTARIEIPNDETLINELTTLERRTASSGRDSVNHQAGAHDDLANAVALAAVRASQTGMDSGPCEIYVGESEFYQGYVDSDGSYFKS